MRTELAFVAILLLAACQSVHAQTPEKAVPCANPSPADGWRTYVDQIHGFCFQYPPSYKRTIGAKHSKEIKFRSLRPEAFIYVLFDDKPFHLERFVTNAPTGVMEPPESVEIGGRTFYYYGPGGGGVDYPDRYFFNLRGKTLYITFDGPYIDDKTPPPETKLMERKLLATFRLLP